MRKDGRLEKDGGERERGRVGEKRKGERGEVGERQRPRGERKAGEGIWWCSLSTVPMA